MGRLPRPGDTFVWGGLATAVALHYQLNGWIIFIALLAIGWGLNEEERKLREREG